MKKSSTFVLLVLAIECSLLGAQPSRHASPPVAAVKTNMSYVDAEPILEALKRELLPAELKGKTPTELAAAWSAWVSRRDAAIRARLERGDEDSIVNFLLFGTSFTRLPRATEREIAKLEGRLSRADLVQGRIEDLLSGLASPGPNERLQFARHVVERKGMNPETAAGKDKLRQYFDEGLLRMAAEIVAIDRAAASARLLQDPRAERLEQATLFRSRGLSSDTSIFTGLAIERALAAFRAEGLLDPGSVRRVAIVGPGLDFTDKRDGYDFYPQQTLQPFAVINSLLRVGLANPADLRVTTFDLSPRVNQHLAAARERARAGSPYDLKLPRDMDLRWTPRLVEYWQRFGDMIGEDEKAGAAPASAGRVQVRGVRISPRIMMSIVPQDLNIILQRLEPLSADERFDLIIATDILVYYEVFEQSLALANLAKMLGAEGFLLSNTAVFELPGIPLASAGYNDVIYIDEPQIGDRLVWYRRQ